MKNCFVFLSTEWVDYVEEPMKYQALRPHFFSVGGWLEGSRGGWMGLGGLGLLLGGWVSGGMGGLVVMIGGGGVGAKREWVGGWGGVVGSRLVGDVVGSGWGGGVLGMGGCGMLRWVGVGVGGGGVVGWW